MSGEKCGSYRVNRNAEREARRLRDASKAADKARQRLEAALAQDPGLAAEEDPPKAVAAGATAEACTAYAAAANGLSAKLERRIANREALQAILSAGADGHAGTWSGSAAAASPVAPTAPAPAHDPNRREVRQELVERLLGRLREATPEEAGHVRSLAESYLACDDDSTAGRIESELRRTLQDANAAGDSRRKARSRAEEMLALLMGLDGKEIIDLRRRIGAAAADGALLPDGIEQDVLEQRGRAIERSDREYVARIFRDELSKCDYRVPEAGFETAFVRGGRIVAADERNPGYAIEMDADPVSSSFVMRVVKLDDPDWSPLVARRDKEVEEEFCDRQERFRARVREAGVDSWLTSAEPAGVRPVPTVAPRSRSDDRVVKKKPERSFEPPRSK